MVNITYGQAFPLSIFRCKDFTAKNCSDYLGVG